MIGNVIFGRSSRGSADTEDTQHRGLHMSLIKRIDNSGF